MQVTQQSVDRQMTVLLIMISNFPHVCRDSKKSERKWSECPSYSSSRNECYFDSRNTVIWYPYAIQLRSRSLDVVYDEISFNVEDIGKPCGKHKDTLCLFCLGMLSRKQSLVETTFAEFFHIYLHLTKVSTPLILQQTFEYIFSRDNTTEMKLLYILEQSM